MFTSGVLLFSVQSGTLPISIIKQCFRKTFVDILDLSLLRKAKITKTQNSDSQAKDSTSAKEVKSVTPNSEEIAARHVELIQFLKEDAAKDFHTEVKRSQRHLRRLEADVLRNPTDEGYQQLHQARLNFAASMSVGPDPFDGLSLPKNLVSTIQVASTAAIDTLQQMFTDATQAQIDIAEEILSISDSAKQWERRNQEMQRYTALYRASLQYQEAIEALYSQIPVTYDLRNRIQCFLCDSSNCGEVLTHKNSIHPHVDQYRKSR